MSLTDKEKERLSATGLYVSEILAFEALSHAAHLCLCLPRTHPRLAPEMAQAFHDIQARLLARPGLRALGWTVCKECKGTGTASMGRDEYPCPKCEAEGCLLRNVEEL
jgi:hypothetical protein